MARARLDTEEAGPPAAPSQSQTWSRRRTVNGSLGLAKMVGAFLIIMSVSAVMVPEAVEATACTGYRLTAADAPTIPQIVSSQPDGTIFCFAAGVYNMTAPITARKNQQFIGEGKGVTILRGSRAVTSWSMASGLHVHSGPTTAIRELRAQCRDGSTACQYQDWVLGNASFLSRAVAPCSTANVTSGRFCIDYVLGKIYTFDPPQDIRYITVPNFMSYASGTGVMIRDMSIVEYGGPTKSDSGWVIDGVEFTRHASAALSTLGTGTVVRNSHFHHNGQIAINLKGTNTRIEGNEIATNNVLGFNASWHAGGIKNTASVDAYIADNHIHDNFGTGLWFDTDASGATVFRNTISDNSDIFGGGDGIRVEISCGITINSNTISGNDRTGINISNSHSVTVGAVAAPNLVTVTTGRAGIRVYGNGRNDGNPVCGDTSWVRNVRMDHNVVTMPATGKSFNGVVREGSTGRISDVTFTGTIYRMGTIGQCSSNRWKLWTGTNQANINFGAWQNTYGHDPSGQCTTYEAASGVVGAEDVNLDEAAFFGDYY